MRNTYRYGLIALALSVLILPGKASAQAGDTLVVEWQDPETGDVIINALRDAIANDTDRPEGRVYKLLRGGLYYNQDTMENTMENDGFHLRIVGETSAPAGEIDYGPAVIQMVAGPSGTARMLSGQDHLTLKNVWITGQDDAGATTSYHPIQFEASGKRIVFDNVIFERSNFAIMGVAGGDNSVFVTNSVYRNFINTTQQWEGRGIRFEAGADTLVMENNTFLNIGHTVVQSEARPINYVRFNHNTIVNLGRTVNSGGLHKEAFYTNNLYINPFWHGEDAGDLSSETRFTTHAGLFGIGELPPAFGTDLDRKVVYANSVHWRDPQFQSYYDAEDITAQPLFNAGMRDGAPATARTTQQWFDELDNMLAANNQWQVDPGVVSYTTAPTVDEFQETAIPLEDLVPSQIETMRRLRAQQTSTWADAWLWDPGRDPNGVQGVGFVWPLPEDLSYTNQALLTAGTDGLPVGDLNWFPEAKSQFEANKEQYVEEIESMVEAAEVSQIATIEAEAGSPGSNAEIQSVEGFTFYQMDGSGFIEWTFELAEEKQFDLSLWTHMRGNAMRGQRVIVNGVSIRDARNWGEYIWDVDSGAHTGMPIDEWVWTRIKQEDLHADYANSLVLGPGTTTVRIEPSWGFQNFAGLRLYEPESDDPALELLAPDATSEIVLPQCADADYCPSGFKQVALGAGGSTSVTVDAPVGGQYMVRVFYEAENTTSAELQVNGTTVLSNLTFSDAVNNIITETFSLTKGANTITLVSDQGDLNVDFIQLFGISLSTGTERNELPEGYALYQNYPNPFNPSTTIQYEMGATGHVTLTVYDILGRQVMTLVDGSLNAGVHQARFDGAGLSSGVYFYRLETPVGQQVRSMMLVK